MKTFHVATLSILYFLLLGVSACDRAVDHENGHGEHGGAHDADDEKGPHGGRLLRDREFSLEMTIFERGVPPEFRAYAFKNDQQIDPASVSLTAELHRFGGIVDKISFSKVEDYLRGDQEIYEPHSFDVNVSASSNGEDHHWEYSSYEGRTEISDEALKNSGVVIEVAGPATIKRTIKAYGTIVPNEERLSEIVPRFPGVVRDVRKRVGETVEKDEILAVVESNESLQRYEVRSPLRGTVVHRNIAPGGYAKEGEAILTVADLSSVWVDLHIARREASQLKLQQTVLISDEVGDRHAESNVAYVAPFGSESTQTVIARTAIPNADGNWKIGFFVGGEILVEEKTVPVAVRANAIQTFRDWDVVFLRDRNLFEIGILELGLRDNEWAEVVSGIKAGQRYATEHSFIIKADIGKSGASHDH